MKKITALQREVKKLGKFAYDSETEGWKGKHYFRFRYDDQVFTVHEDDDFIAEWDAKKVHQVFLKSEDAGLTFLNYATREQLLDEATFEADLKDIKERNVKATVVTNPESLV